jgi:hypothetical protein
VPVNCPSASSPVRTRVPPCHCAAQSFCFSEVISSGLARKFGPVTGISSQNAGPTCDFWFNLRISGFLQRPLAACPRLAPARGRAVLGARLPSAEEHHLPSARVLVRLAADHGAPSTWVGPHSMLCKHACAALKAELLPHNNAANNNCYVCVNALLTIFELPCLC